MLSGCSCRKNQQETTFVLKGACSSLTLDESRRRWGVQSSWLSLWWPGCLVRQRHSAPVLSACTAPDWGKSRYTTGELSTWSLKNILVLINSRLTQIVLWQQLRWWTSFLFQEGRRKAGLGAETPAELWWDTSLDKIRSKNFVKSEMCANFKTFVLCTELSLSFIMVYSLQLNILSSNEVHEPEWCLHLLLPKPSSARPQPPPGRPPHPHTSVCWRVKQFKTQRGHF